MNSLGEKELYTIEKSKKVLEFDKVLELIKQETVLYLTKDRLDALLPMNDINAIRRSLDEVDEALMLVNRMGRISIYFHTNVDYNLTKVLKGGVLTIPELVETGNFLDTIRDLYVYLEKLDANKIEAPLFKEAVNFLYYPKDLNLKIKSIVTPYGEIKDDASSELKHIRKSIKDTDTNIKNKLVEVLHRNAGRLTQAVIQIRNDRYCLPVKTDAKSQVKGIIHDQSSSGETTFIEPLIICELNNKLNSLKEDEKREINNILRNISLNICGVAEELKNSFNALIDLDVVFAKAKYALSINACKPSVNDENYLELYNAYHPLLNVPNIVKNNIKIGKDYKGIIITGPNTGGKTVLLKTVGLLSLMVKYGVLVPCSSESNIMIFDNVYADIGDEQSISQNLSTFSSHLKNVIGIIDNVTSNSLVILDELGSGTDPAEGSSLAISIFDYLLEKKCLIIASSHYSELKIHAYNSDDLINASVEFNPETLQPTYRLLIGVPGMSNALNIASNLGLKPEIVSSAKDYVYKKNDNLNNMLDKLIKQSYELESELKKVEELKLDLNNKIIKQDKEIEKTIEERNKIIFDANVEKEKLINKTRDEIDELIYELNQMKSKGVKNHEIADMKHKIREMQSTELDEIVKEDEIELNEGVRVYLKGFHTYGVITKVLKNDRFEVSVGNASMKLDRDELQAQKEGFVDNSSYKVTKQPTVEVGVKKHVSPKLDLRGMRYEEAKEEISKYLDDCLYASLNIVTIVHGFGTGTIRKLVWDMLENNPNVSEFRFGGEKEGGMGATVVTLKK